MYKLITILYNILSYKIINKYNKIKEMLFWICVFQILVYELELE